MVTTDAGDGSQTLEGSIRYSVDKTIHVKECGGGDYVLIDHGDSANRAVHEEEIFDRQFDEPCVDRMNETTTACYVVQGGGACELPIFKNYLCRQSCGRCE